MPFSIVGMGRLGGAEMSYASDLDLLLVYDGADDVEGEAVAEALLQLMHGPSPAQRVATIDLGLRPEGGQGRLARDLHGYATYFDRWAETWERQALGPGPRRRRRPRRWAQRFMTVLDEFVWGRPLTEDDVAAIRRMKARIERERIPTREDPQFHLKLGRGRFPTSNGRCSCSSSATHLPGPSTHDALEALGDRGVLAPADLVALRDAYRFCERTRNRWHLVGALPGGGSPGRRAPHPGRPALPPGEEPGHHPGVAARRLPPSHPAGPAGGRAHLLRDRGRVTILDTAEQRARAKARH